MRSLIKIGKATEKKSVTLIQQPDKSISSSLSATTDERIVSRVRLQTEEIESSGLQSHDILEQRPQQKSSQILVEPERKASETSKKNRRTSKTKGRKSNDALLRSSAQCRRPSSLIKQKKSGFDEEDEYEIDEEEDEEEITTARRRGSAKQKKSKKTERRGTHNQIKLSKTRTPETSKTGGSVSQISILKKSRMAGSLKTFKMSKSKSLVFGEEKVDYDLVDDDYVMTQLARIKAYLTVPLDDLRSMRSRDTQQSVFSTSTRQSRASRRKKKMTITNSGISEGEMAKITEQDKVRREEVFENRIVERQKREIGEQLFREEQLAKSMEAIDEIVNYSLDLAKTERENLEWQLYIDCGRLPDPSFTNQMTTYLHLWSLKMNETTLEEASKRSYDVIKLLNDLEDLLDSEIIENVRHIDNLKWIYGMMKEYQNTSLDVATYRTLKYVDQNMNRVDIPTADFHFHDDFVNLNLWLRVNLPIPLPNPRRPPKPRMEVSFPSLNVTLLFPPNIDGENMAVRLMYLSYDHFSEKCQSYYQRIPTFREDLLTSITKERRTKLLYMYKEYMNKKSGGKNLDVQMDFRPDEDIPLVPYQKLDPNPSDYCLKEDCDNFLNYMIRLLAPPKSDYELSLREYAIIGGVFYIDLFYQPPQPQEYVTLDLKFATFSLPKELKKVPFYEKYVTSKSAISAEVSSAALQQLASIVRSSMNMTPIKMSDISIISKQEDKGDTLLRVTMEWPKHVIFLTTPEICRWNSDDKYWTKADIKELKVDDENGIITFYTGIFGVFAFATQRYAHLPFKNWRIIPEKDESVRVKIITQGMRMDFNIKGGLISLVLLTKYRSTCLQDIIGKYIKLSRLRRYLKTAGVDIFPEADASCYVSKISEKHEPMETHLYYNIAMLSNSFKFARSQWNADAGRRNIVLEMKEFCPDFDKVSNTYSTLVVTPVKTSFINYTESSPTFYYLEMENMKFSADLYNLMKITSGIAIRNKVMRNKKDQVFTLARFLISIRLLSFS